MKTVLVTAIGSFSADIVIKSLKKHGMRVIGCDIFPKEWVVDAYSVDRFIQVPRGTDVNMYREAISNICIEEDVDFVIPLTDVEVDALNEFREWFLSHEVTLCVSPQETINVCRDKMHTYETLLEAGLESFLIPTVRATDFDRIDDTWFPVICKPYNGRSSQGIQRFKSRQRLISYLESVHPKDYLVQPIKQGSIITVDVLRLKNGESVVAVPRRELLRTLNGAGTAVRVFHDDELAAICRNIANQLGVVGCVNFEFIRSENGEYSFLECNPRFSGGIEFSCMIGYDFVRNHLACFCEEPIDSLNSYKDCFISRKYEEYITSITD